MRMPALLRQILLFLPYAFAVWVTAYHGLRGSDVLGLVSALLLIGGAVVLLYMRFLRRTVQPGLFSPATFFALGLLGLALGTMSSGEAAVGVAAGLVAGGGAAAAAAMSASRRRRRPRTLFLSYRRADSGDITPRIRDRLAARFGEKNIFMDVTSIELGGRFRDIIADAVSHSDALIAVIGEQWLSITDEAGRRRLDAEDDLVRIEIETALANDKVLVVPLAVQGADIPEAQQLPASIRDLAGRNGGVVGSDENFEADMQRLITGLEQGSVTPWSRAAPRPIPWRRVAVLVAILLAPLSWYLLEVVVRDNRFITSASLSPDRSAVATAHGVGIGVNSRVRIWDTGSGALLHTLRVGDGPVWSVAWAPDGAHLAFGDHDGTLVIVETERWREVHRAEQHAGMLQQIAWSPDGQWVATGDTHGSVRAWSAATGALRFTAHAHAQDVEMLRWSPAGQRIASAGRDGRVVITNAMTGATLAALEGPGSSVTAVAWSATGDHVAAGAFEAPYAMIWPADGAAAGTALAGHGAVVDDLEFSPVAARLATASRDDTVRLWTATGTLEHVLDLGYGSGRPEVAWSPDGLRIAAATDEDVLIWSAADGRRLDSFQAHRDDYEVRILGWWPDANRLATSGSWDRAVKVWRVGEPEPIAEIRLGVLAALKDRFF